MNELTYSDLIYHYKRKLLECGEDIDGLKEKILFLEDLEREAWQGAAASAFLDKLHELLELFGQISSDLEQSRKRLQNVETVFGSGYTDL